jgi:protein-disulfide isomerase
MRSFLFGLAALCIAWTLGPAAAQETTAPAPAAPAQSSPFSDAEREAIHAEIRSYLLANPDLMMEMLQLLEEQQRVATEQGDRDLIAENAAAIFDDGFSWVGGNPDGRFTIVEFLDYQCGFCRKAQPEVAELLESDGDIKLVIKEMPILGAGSELAARAAVATLVRQGPEAYGRLHDRLMRQKGGIEDASLDKALVESGLDPASIRVAMDDPEVGRRIAETRALAEKLAITGTPTFVFDNRLVRGYLPLAQMRALVEEVRATN